ncbi:MAG: tRNA (guanosine(46)-N7)-methyltransferase TrmB [Coxiellaceae bacterium]|nr:tRNA (guanosine(46)-N7)-methyltransferase TrmB [Coxiellaceae bacterium]
MRTIKLREVKSFVRRQRRLSVRFEQAMDVAWPTFGVAASDEVIHLDTIFNRAAPKILEIGFGHGDTLLPMALQNPDNDYLGIEVHEPGIAAVMTGILEHELKNIRVIQQDAVKVLEENIFDSTFSRIHIYFPDPWHKKRHHKRRLINATFVALLIQKLIPGGVIHCATDWENYAEQMMHVLSEATTLQNCCGDQQYADNAKMHLRTNTKFEKRGVKLGHGVWDLLFQKI